MFHAYHAIDPTDSYVENAWHILDERLGSTSLSSYLHTLPVEAP